MLLERDLLSHQTNVRARRCNKKIRHFLAGASYLTDIKRLTIYGSDLKLLKKSENEKNLKFCHIIFFESLKNLPMKKNDLESYILDSFAFSAKNIVNSIFGAFSAFYSGAQTKPNGFFWGSSALLTV